MSGTGSALGAAVLAAVLAAGPAAGGEPVSPGDAAPAPSAVHLSLPEAVARALEANPGLRAQAHRSTAADHSARAAGRNRWGRLDAFFNYTRTNDDWIVRPMSRQMFEDVGGFDGLPWDRNQRHWGLTFQIPLYLGGELSGGIRLRELEAKRAGALLEGTRWQVRFNAVSLYTAVQALDATTGATTELITALEATRDRLDLMVSTGKRPRIDRLKVEEELADARAQRASLAADRTRAASLLLALLGRDPSGSLAVDPLPHRPPTLTMTPEELRAAVAESSAVRRARLAAEQGRREVEIATSAFIPRVTASGNVTRSAAPSLDDPLDTWQVSVGVAVPLFHGASRVEELAAAREREKASRESVVQAELEARARLEEALARFESTAAELAAARARVAAASEAARIEQIRYDTGAGTVEDLLRARSREHAARASLAGVLGAVVTWGERINSIVEKEAVR